MLKTSWRWTYRIAAAAVLLAGLVFAGVVLSLRYWLLPNIGQYRTDIAASVSRAAGTPVTIGAIAADWQGLRPHLSLDDVQVYDRQGHPALALRHVDGTLAWWSFLLGEVRLYSLEIDNLNLSVRRDPAGRIFIAGIEVNKPESGGGFADWLLRQHRILARNAAINWQDEQRGAPPLVLSQVDLRVVNGWHRHRFGLRAVPPTALAGPVDVRGDVTGETLQDMAAWKGTLYASLDRVDLNAWKPWLPLPPELTSGSGNVRLWLGFADKQVDEITADLNLSGVHGRYGADVPELDLKSATGRLSWRNLQPGFEFSTRNLGLVAQAGIVVQPVDALFRYVPAQEGKLAQGEARANRLRLEPLVSLAAYLPLSAEQRGQLAGLNPRGGFRDFQVKWSGDWYAPESYAVKGAFIDLGVRAVGKQPGLSGLSGHLDATQQGGTLSLDSRGVSAEFPGIFAAAIPLDHLTAQAGWKISKKNVLDLKLTNLSVANEDAAGTVYGSYRSAPGTPGMVDLTGQFSRAEARRVERYLPLVVGEATRNWLKQSILAGRSGDVRLRLKGNLADFPFPGDKGGVFEVAAKVDGGVLEYAPGWPRIENIGVDLRFHGARMDVLARQGTTYGMKLEGVHAAIPDLLSSDERVEVEGKASGPTNDMLKFIANSPVNGMIDGVTDGMQATGEGKLALKLEIPLRHNRDTQVSGSYQFINNRVLLGPGSLPLEQVNGMLTFTQNSMALPGISAQLLGGPMTISGATQKDGSVRLDAQGRVSAIGLRKAFDYSVVRYLSGQADWHGTVNVRKNLADVVIDSNTVGLGSTLPFPFSKAPNAAVPLRLERKIADAHHDTVLFGYGRLLSGQLLRRRDNGTFKVERGVINLGGPANLPAAGGLWLTGDLGFLDLDRWRGVMGGGGSTAPGITGLNLKFGAVDAFGKRISNVRLNAKAVNGEWQANVQSKEFAGDVNWHSEGHGKVVARLKYLTVPPAAPTKIGVPTEPPPEKELPALDVVADEFEIAQKKMGRLELQALPEDDDWRIEKLKLSAPDSTLQMDGVWQTWRRQPRTRVHLHLDVRDLGKLLARMGFPNTVKQGEAELDGQLSWLGSPQNLNFPTLSGQMKLEARKGQFLKIEPGIGKLLGILSLQALPQRIALDFRDVFSDGFAFDDISATVRVAQGVASSDDFSMAGSAALVSMSGETNLVDETQNLRVHVIPVVGGSVATLSALLGGPVVGLTAVIVQKILKEPLGQMIAYDYRITGTWDNPKVEKLARKIGPSSNEEIKK